MRSSPEEWWPVVGFPGYEMTEDYKLRHRILGPVTKLPDGSVMLQRGGKRVHRSVGKLVRETFGERELPVVELPGFRPIPSAPGYSISRRTEEVYSERNRRMLNVNPVSGTVVLNINGRQVKKVVRSLIREAWGPS